MKRVIIIALVTITASISNSSINGQSTLIRKVSIKDVKAMIDTSTGPTIINFWASWCGPCIREIPYFDSLINAEKKPVKFILVSVDYPDAYPKQLTAFVKKQGYSGEVVYLNETNPQYYCPIIDKQWKDGAIPASIFVNNSKNFKEFYPMQLTRERLAIEFKKLF